MKYSLSLLSTCVLSFILIYGCSTEEEEESVAPVVQTPQPEPEPEPIEYTLTVSAADGGTVSTEGGTYDEGTDVTITASANEGYRFTGWEGNDSANESLTITLNSDQTLQALFELIPIYTLTVTTGEGGTVSTEGGEYQEGTEIEITAIPEDGYRFDGWEGNESNESAITINISSDTEISPIFNLIIQAPASYGVDEYWGKIVDFEPEFFFSSDLPEFAQEGLKETVKLVSNYFGLYGPIEIWSVGRDASSSEKRELESIYCERRSNRNQGNYEDCVSEQRFENIGSSINGKRELGYHLMHHRNDFSFANNSDYRHYAMTTMTHEYTHIVQAANLFTKNEEDRPDGGRRRIGWGPIFFSEGTAVYYAEFIQRKLRQNGTPVENAPNVDSQGGSLRNKMRKFMENDIIPYLDTCPNFNIWDVNYSTRETCSPYRLGAWGVAYLLDKVNDQDAFWKTLWPNIDEMGWDGAFEHTFGITMEQFNQEFLEFLELPIEQQLEIIPDI
ncbi:InlB B-repeat-containing protein [Cyclobacteriaceae bacterium]|nr:InlB B-repeat-containing protein [Cyclobacteriaceae bacterium]